MSESSEKKIVLFESELEKEAAKVAGAVIGRSANGVMDTVSDIFGGLIGDAIREWRTRNLVTSLARTAEMLKTKGVKLDKAKALPMGEAYAMFEEASKQDDPTIAEMWSALLANAMDRNSDVRIESGFVTTLRAIGPAEAKTLKIVQEFKRKREEILATEHFGKDRNLILGVREATSPRIRAALANLREKYAPELTDEQIDIALSNLIKERCLCIPAPVYERWDVADPFSRGTPASPEKLQDALNDIAGSVNEHSGYTAANPKLLRDDMLPTDINFDLTKFGLRLLTACESPSATTPTAKNN